MLQVRASPTFLHSTTSSSSPPSSSQAPPTPFPFWGKSQRRGGLVAAPSANRTARRSVMAAAGAAPAAAKLEDAAALIDSVETFIFDCDGVIWKGDKLIDGVPDTLDLLRSKGKRLVFVTNNSTKSRKQYGKKFETLGLSVDEEEIFASSFAAAAYLQSIDFPKDKKVYVIGEEGILKELELAGFQHLGGPTDGDKKIELKPGFYMEHDEDVGAVVVGFDRYFNYYKVQYGTLCIRENPGCLFIATNRDAVTHLTDAQEWAGGGSMVGAIIGSTKQEPLVVGKPSTFMMDYLAKKFGITTSQICMVGDRLDTDILFGQNGGCKTLLVLSALSLAVPCRCYIPADASEPRQLDPARFLHKSNFRFSHPQNSYCLKEEPVFHLHRQHRPPLFLTNKETQRIVSVFHCCVIMRYLYATSAMCQGYQLLL